MVNFRAVPEEPAAYWVEGPAALTADILISGQKNNEDTGSTPIMKGKTNCPTHHHETSR